MEFRKIVALRGPNIWAKSPVLEAWVELGDLKDSPSNEMPGFNARLMGWLPEMIEHECSLGKRGGFFERLERGTYLAHILEHVTLELQNRAGTPIGYGRARETSQEGLFRVAFRYEEEAIARACVMTARELCLAAVHDRPFDVQAEVKGLRLLADDVRMGPSTRAMVAAAKARGIPVRRLSEGSLVQLGHGAKQHRILRSATGNTGAVAEVLSDDKQVTKEYLLSAGVPVADGRLATSAADAWQAAQEIGTPVVVKPKDGNYGNAVVIGIARRDQIEAAYTVAATVGTGVIVERYCAGAEHRLLVVGGKFAAATRGEPAFVTGDGRQTVAELIESQLNLDPRRGEDSSFPLRKVEFDAGVLLVLENAGYRADSVPERGTRVMVQQNGNLSTDETDEVHPEVARVAETAAAIIGLDVAGIDIIAHDVGRPLEEQGGVVIEVNAGPGLQMHTEPEFGKTRPVAEKIVETLYPEGEDGRIPLVAVTGNDDTAAVTNLVASLLAGKGRTVGVAKAEGTFIGQQCIHRGDSRAAGARRVLLNPRVEAAVFEISLDSVLDEGLGFDRCQVAVITSMGEGRKLDLAEWDSPSKMSLAYRGVSDVVLKDGFVVLQAGEPLTPVVDEYTDGALVLVAIDENETALTLHRSAGGRVVFSRKAVAIGCDGASETALGKLPTGVPPMAALQAIAAAWCAGWTP